VGLHEGAVSGAREEYRARVRRVRPREPVSGAPQTASAGHVVSARTAPTGQNAPTAAQKRFSDGEYEHNLD